MENTLLFITENIASTWLCSDSVLIYAMCVPNIKQITKTQEICLNSEEKF